MSRQNYGSYNSIIMPHLATLASVGFYRSKYAHIIYFGVATLPACTHCLGFGTYNGSISIFYMFSSILPTIGMSMISVVVHLQIQPKPVDCINTSFSRYLK